MAPSRLRSGPGGFPEATDHRQGVQSTTRGASAVDGAIGGRAGGETQAGSARGTRNHSDLARKPRPETVAGKKCGAWRNSMTLTSLKWRMFSRFTRNPTMRPNRLYVWTRNLSRYTPISRSEERRVGKGVDLGG